MSSLGYKRVCVAGVRLAGAACARALLARGCQVTVVDGGTSPEHERWAADLESAGARVVLGEANSWPVDTNPDLLVVSPGFPPHAPIITAAIARGIPVWGELELAWRVRSTDAPWLFITGTNGKTTATLMLEQMLLAAGYRAKAAGNIGISLVDEVQDPNTEVFAVEVGAPQLPNLPTVAAHAAVCLNVAPDHIDHFGGFANYRAAKQRVFTNCQRAAVYNAADSTTKDLAQGADLGPDCETFSFTLTSPSVGQLGVADGQLIDRAYADRAVLADVTDVHPAADHNVANALAAAALARSLPRVQPDAVARGLHAFAPAPHRLAQVGSVDGVDYVDDSKATNTHAAQTAMTAFEKIVWIAGGLAKGQDFDELVQTNQHRLRAVVLLGRDRDRIAAALDRHAPQIPTATVTSTDTGAMFEVVAQAARFAEPGDTVLLAPGCASWDMFRTYEERGDIFAEAVGKLTGDS